MPERAGFGMRLSYARWLKHLAEGDAPTNAELGRAVGFTGQWASQWQRRVDAPADPAVRRALAGYLGVGADWLFEGHGAAPEPELWRRWTDAREGRGTGPIPKARSRRVVEDEPAVRAPARRRA